MSLIRENCTGGEMLGRLSDQTAPGTTGLYCLSFLSLRSDCSCDYRSMGLYCLPFCLHLLYTCEPSLTFREALLNLLNLDVNQVFMTYLDACQHLFSLCFLIKFLKFLQNYTYHILPKFQNLTHEYELRNFLHNIFYTFFIKLPELKGKSP